MNDLHIVTVATESKYYFPYLVDSCKKNGKELEVLGYGEKWRGLNWKFKLMIDYLKKLPETDIVCFVDGYDVLCVRNLDEMREEFLRIKKETGCKIVVAKEEHANEFVKWSADMIFDNCKDININAGTYIGMVNDILDILSEIQKENPEDEIDDQKILIDHCKKHSDDFYIDIYNKFFFAKVAITHELYNDVEIKNNEIYVHGNKPFFIHAPGGGFLDNIIIKMGYPYDSENKVRDILYVEQITKKFWYTSAVKYIYYFLFIIFFIFTIYYLSTMKSIRKMINQLVKIIR